MLRRVSALFAVLGLVLLSTRGTAGSAPRKLNVDPANLLRLEVAVLPGDPFDPANAAKSDQAALKVRRGQTVFVQISGRPQEGYHTYPLTVPGSSQQKELSRLKVGPAVGLVPLGAVVESTPFEVTEKDGKGKSHSLFQHDRPFTWTQEVYVSAEAAPGKVELPIKVNTQVCDEHQCHLVKRDLHAVVEVSAEPPLTPDAATQQRLDAQKAAAAVVPPPGPRPNPPPTPPSPAREAKTAAEPLVGLISVSHEEYKARMELLAGQIVKREMAGTAGGDLLGFILAGIFWGGISLVTPCVFPMIPITVSFFLKQSEKQHHRPVTMASVYSLTIVVVLTLAAAFLLSVFRWLSVTPLMNYALGGLFIFFALSLFGMYEIELPSGLARFTSARERRGGLVGTIFMALTFTIISFACVAPFLGGFGGTAAAARPLWHNLLGGLAFSATFAAPFFFLALFPTLLKALPKSGAWLNSVKVVMGFLELAAAFKFLRGAELLQSGGDISVFSYDLVLGIWIALAVLCGLYLLGVFRLPHDTPAENIGVPRLLFSAAFIGLGLYLAPALFKVNSEGAPQRPGGAVYAWVDAFLLPESRGGGVGTKENPKTGDLYYAVEKAREHLRKTGEPKRVLVDFTGIICSNCRYNEQSVFPRPDVQQALQQYIGVEMYTDGMPVELYAPAIQAELARDSTRGDADAKVNERFQNTIFNAISLPMYAILEPRTDGTIRIVDVYEEGRIMNVAEFVRFVSGERARSQDPVARN